MKIAILLLTGGLVNRGAEHSLIMLAEDWQALGHDVTVFQTGPKPSQSKVNFHQIGLPWKPSSHKPTTILGKILERLYLNPRGLATLFFSLKVAAKLKPFDVLIPTDGFWQVLLCRQFKSPKAKVVTIGLSGPGWTDRDTLKLRPDMFVALSPKAAEWAAAVSPRTKIATIPLQVDLEKFARVSPSAQISLPPPIVLTVAALTKYKRVDLIIRAVAPIPGVSLLILGQGEEFEALSQLARTLLPGRHQFLTTTFDTLPSIYHAAQVFTLVSDHQEAFGQVLVEAMAAGLPVVTADDPIRRWIVGDAGLFVDPTNLAAYTQQLKIALAIKQPVVYTNLNRFERKYVANLYHQLFTA